VVLNDETKLELHWGSRYDVLLHEDLSFSLILFCISIFFPILPSPSTYWASQFIKKSCSRANVRSCWVGREMRERHSAGQLYTVLQQQKQKNARGAPLLDVWLLPDTHISWHPYPFTCACASSLQCALHMWIPEADRFLTGHGYLWWGIRG
jgi:hypothetical protein